MSLMHLMNIDGAGGSDTPPAATTPAPPAPAPSSALDAIAAAAAPVVRRKIGVGRREIRNAAETCYPKTPAQTASRVTGPVPESRVQVVINSSRPNLSGEMSVDTSAPGSIHDSADDESELSELEEDDGDDEEETLRKPLFPGLAGRERTEGEDSEMDGGTDEAGEDEGEDTEMGGEPQGDKETELEEGVDVDDGKVQDAEDA
jgi:hypothetical protein